MTLSVAPFSSMDTSTFSSMGVGSGLPLGSLMTQLQTSENLALEPIQSQEDSLNAKISAYGKLKSAVSALQTAAQTLSSTGTFTALKTSVTGSAFTASAGSGAVAGQYSVTVDQLATAQTLYTAGQTSNTTANGTGGTLTLTLKNGTTQSLDLTGKDTSLNGLVSAINGDPSLGVSATIINDGSATPYHLMLIANKTGDQSAVTSISSSNSALQSMLGFTQGTASSVAETAASNASVHINGIAVTSQSNTLQNAIQGVTLNLSAVDASPSTLSITHDDSQITQAVQGFVTAYNGLQSTIQSLTAYNTATQSGSILTGDPVALQVQEQMFGALNTVVSGTTTYQSAFQLGLSTDPTSGSLTLDTNALSAALSSNPGDVQAVLGGTRGLGSAFQTLSTNMLQTGGLFSNASDSMNQMMTDLQSQYTQTSDRISADMENYRQQFTALDSTVGQMNSLSSYLTQQLAHL